MMSGSVGVSELDTILVFTWLKKLGGTRKILRIAVAAIVEFLVNKHPP